ncbi:MAG: F0F1 ATP synthase subunit B [Chitinophagales bacterium]
MELVTPAIGLVFWTTVVFILLLIVLRVFAWKPILKAVEEREESIENALKSAEQAKAEMEKLNAKNETILAEAREDKTRMIQEAKAAGEKIISEAKEKASLESQRNIENAKREIENQKDAAKAELKKEVGTMALEIAEKLLRKELENKGAQEELASKLVEDFKLN